MRIDLTAVKAINPILHGSVVFVGVASILLSPFLGLPHWNVAAAVHVSILGIGAASVAVLFGKGGMLTLGNALFMGVGAYTMGILVGSFSISPIAGAMAGIAAASIASFLLGSIIVRVSGFFFTVGTLALAAAFEGVLRAQPSLTGGATGLVIERTLPLGVFTVHTDLQWYGLCVVVALGVVAVLRYLEFGKTHRLLMLLKADQLSASVLGLDVIRLRRQLFIISGTIGGIAGILLFLWQGVMVPESAGILRSVELVALSVVGGIQSWAGPFIGTFTLEWLSRAGRFLGSIREVVYGVSFLAIVLFAPGGLTNLLQRFRPKFAIQKREGDPYTSESGESPPGERQMAHTDHAGSGRLRIVRVSKQFGGVVALHNVSMEVTGGSVTALVGGNGAGKSTLLNIISGIESPTRGQVYVDDQNLAQLTPAERTHAGLARTFQVPRLVSGLTVLDNIALGADALSTTVFRRTHREEVATRSAAFMALERDNLGHLAGRLAAELGSGERKLVELTRALAWGGSTLLMDEPAVGLEDNELQIVLVRIRELANQGVAVLVIDHNMDFIGEIADRVYVLDQGSIIYDGAVEQALAFWRSGNPHART